MKLASIELRDFQAHGRLKLPLDPGINTIKGSSDVGKSAVVRAIQWLCMNSLAGDSFIREGAEHAEVRIHLADGTDLRRLRGAANTYHMDGQEFRSFGTSVPQEIQDTLQLSWINFQSQHDPPFWFTESAPEVSRQLNAVIDLSVIDTTLAHAATTVRRSQERVSLSEERLAELQKEDIKAMDRRVQAFQKLMQEKAKQKREHEAALETLLERARSHRDAARQHQAREEAGRSLLSLARKARELSSRTHSLQGLLTTASHHHRTQPPADYGPIMKAHDTWNQCAIRLQKLQALVVHQEQAAQHLKACEKTLLQTEQEFHRNTSGQACPLCGGRFA